MSNPRQRDGTPTQGSLLNSSPLASKFGGVDTKENEYEPEPQASLKILQTPVDKIRDATGNTSQLITPPNSCSNSQVQSQPGLDQQLALASTTSPSFTFSFNPQPSTSANKSLSKWESRARSESPAASLARHAADGREKKKSKFLDRIRQRREDSRAEKTGDQVLRMDFVNERRAWENEMRRRATLEQPGDPEMDIDVDVDVETGMMWDCVDQSHMSPPQEYDEVDGGEYAMNFGGLHSRNGSQEFLVDDIDPDEYDALFMEILSQDASRSFAHHPPQAPNPQNAQHSPPFDSSMDLS